jgi:hypothetical protein
MPSYSNRRLYGRLDAAVIRTDSLLGTHNLVTFIDSVFQCVKAPPFTLEHAETTVFWMLVFFFFRQVKILATSSNKTVLSQHPLSEILTNQMTNLYFLASLGVSAASPTPWCNRTQNGKETYPIAGVQCEGMCTCFFLSWVRKKSLPHFSR